MKIKVGLYGMDKRSEDRMLTLFSMNFKGQCEYTDIESADTVIIDMDDKNVTSEWSEFRGNHPDIPVIIMAQDHVELIGTTYISKPAKLAELLAALKVTSNKEISSNLNTNQNTHHAAKALQKRFQKPSYVDKADTSESFELFYNPEDFLQGQITKAINKSNEMNKDMFIKCWTNQWLLISPHTNYLLQNITDFQVKTLGLVPLGEELAYSEHVFSDNEISHMSSSPTNNVKIISIEQFMWNITIKTARGRAPFGSSLDELYVLTHWPNLTRLNYIPNATRISAFWVDQAQSINNIINKLHIPFQDVSTFFSAASAIGLIKPAKRNEDHLNTPDVITTDKKKHNIFSALINKVSKNIKRNKNSQSQGA